MSVSTFAVGAFDTSYHTHLGPYLFVNNEYKTEISQNFIPKTLTD